MAISSRHYPFLSAIKSALVDDADIVAAGWTEAKWLIRKRPWSRNKTGVQGYICPGRRSTVASETSRDEIMLEAMVAISAPTNQDLEADMDDHMGVIELIEDIFRRKSHGNAPASLRNLTSLYADPSKYYYSFQHVDSVSASTDFIESGFRAGYDVCACTIKAVFLIRRLDVSSYGA